MTTDRQTRWQGIAIGAVLLAIGAGLCIGTFNVHTLPGQDSLGPRLFPILIGGGLVILGLAHFVTAWRQRQGLVKPAEPSEFAVELPPGHWPTLAWVVAGVALGAALYNFLGFVLAAIAVFVLTARGFAGRFAILHVVVGLVLAIAVYVGFTAGLGLRLPAGIFKGLF